MYQIIWYFQITCIVMTLGCVYFAGRNTYLKTLPCRDTWMLTMISLLVAECGYGLYFQAVTLEGLMIARKVYLIAGIMALTSWIVTVVLCLDDEREMREHRGDSTAMSSALSWILGLTASAFVASDRLDNYLFYASELAQNQYFYYIKEVRRGLYDIGKGVAMLSLAVLFVWILLKKVENNAVFIGKRRVWFGLATVLPCMVLLIGDLPVFRNYPVMAPVMTIVSVVLALGLPGKTE